MQSNAERITQSTDLERLYFNAELGRRGSTTGGFKFFTVKDRQSGKEYYIDNTAGAFFDYVKSRLEITDL